VARLGGQCLRYRRKDASTPTRYTANIDLSDFIARLSVAERMIPREVRARVVGERDLSSGQRGADILNGASLANEGEVAFRTEARLRLPLCDRHAR